MLNQRPGGSAFCWVLAFSTTSYRQLLWTPTQSKAPQGPQGPQGPLRPGVAFPTTSRLLLQLSDFLSWLSYIIVQRPLNRALNPSYVWLSSSGNNCHAVHKSLSSGASVYECTMGFFYLVPFHQPNTAYAISFDYWSLGCVTSFRCITLEWHICPGRRSKYNINPYRLFNAKSIFTHIISSIWNNSV